MSASHPSHTASTPDTDAVVPDQSGTAGDELRFLDAGPGDSSKKRRKSQRTCLVTRAIKSPDQMVRFVLSPDGTVTPDVKAVLPGRGVWVTATRTAVDEAVSRKLFSRGFKTQCVTPSDLGATLDDILARFAFGALSMARASGDAISGFAKVDALIRSNEAALVLDASDASDDGFRKICQAVRFVEAMEGEPPRIFRSFTGIELASSAIRKNDPDEGGFVTHLALRRSGSSRSALQRINRLIAYRDLLPVDVNHKKRSNTPKTGTRSGSPARPAKKDR